MELASKDRVLERAIAAVTQRSLPVVLEVQAAIVEAYRDIESQSLRGLKDAEILEAVENAIKNLETRDSGLIYEHQAPPRVEAISRVIRAALDEMSERTPAESRPRLSELLKVLEVIRALIGAHMRNGQQDDNYLRYISLFVAWRAEQAKPLII